LLFTTGKWFLWDAWHKTAIITSPLRLWGLALTVSRDAEACVATPQYLPLNLKAAAGARRSQWPSKAGTGDFDSDDLNSFVNLCRSEQLGMSLQRVLLWRGGRRARQPERPFLPSVDSTGNANFLAGHSSQGAAVHDLIGRCPCCRRATNYWIFGENRAAALSGAFWLALLELGGR